MKGFAVVTLSACVTGQFIDPWQYQQQPFLQQPFPPQQPPQNVGWPTDLEPTTYYTSQRNYLADRPQFGAPVIGPITGIKMPSVEAHSLAKKYPMAYFPAQSAVHPPTDDYHVQTYYHTHDHVHLTDPLLAAQAGHPFVLSSKTQHPDVVQEHTQAFQHGHIHYHIVEGTDPCNRADSDNDCGDLAPYEEAVTLAEWNAAQAELQAALAELGR